MTKRKPKIIIWDLETLANLPRVMHYLPGMSAYPGLTMKATHNTIICCGWKELGEKARNCNAVAEGDSFPGPLSVRVQ